MESAECCRLFQNARGLLTRQDRKRGKPPETWGECSRALGRLAMSPPRWFLLLLTMGRLPAHVSTRVPCTAQCGPCVDPPGTRLIRNPVAGVDCAGNTSGSLEESLGITEPASHHLPLTSAAPSPARSGPLQAPSPGVLWEQSPGRLPLPTELRTPVHTVLCLHRRRPRRPLGGAGCGRPGRVGPPQSRPEVRL